MSGGGRSAGALDLRRQPFGKWLVLYQGAQTGHGQFWVCQCACTARVTVALHEQALLEGWTRSCGCDYVRSNGLPQQVCNLVGRQMGQWLVLSAIAGHRDGLHYACRCVCGTEKHVLGQSLAQGVSRQCRACSKRQVLPVRWQTDTLFVEKCVGVHPTSRHLLYACQFADGTTHILKGADICRGAITGVGGHKNQGKLAADVGAVLEVLLPLLRQGAGYRRMAQVLGVSSSGVARFLKAHPELKALAASLPADEEFVDTE